jgi:hypothetical protein
LEKLGSGLGQLVAEKPKQKKKKVKAKAKR